MQPTQKPAADRERWASLKHRVHTLSQMLHFLNTAVRARLVLKKAPFVSDSRCAAIDRVPLRTSERRGKSQCTDPCAKSP
jgi:hypothetical protein